MMSPYSLEDMNTIFGLMRAFDELIALRLFWHEELSSSRTIQQTSIKS